MLNFVILLAQSSWVGLCYEYRKIIAAKLEMYMKNSIVPFILLTVFACGKAKKETELSKGMSVDDSMNHLDQADADGDFDRKDDGNESSSDRSPTPEELEGYDYTAKLIPAGTFTMGCTSEQGSDCWDDEKPAHKVTISKDFYLMESEVTQALYERVMGYNPSYFKRPNRPVETVSWNNALKFCNKLSEMEGLDQCYTINGNDVSWSNKSCNGWRLPTEAEWEYAARGGQSYKYSGSDNVDEVAWYDDNSGSPRKTQDVCGKTRNGYGLCDMSGNVFEWVWDWYGDYSSQSGTDLVGPNSDQFPKFMNRGGSWYHDARYTRVSARSHHFPVKELNYLGFRPGRTP